MAAVQQMALPPVPLLIVMLFPLVWMLITSIELPREAHQFPPVLIPSEFHWQNYPNALEAAPFGRFFINSTIVAVTVVAGNLIFCSLAGYAFARINFAGKNMIFILLLATLMVPFQVTMIPAFLIVKWLGLHVSPLIGIDSLGRAHRAEPRPGLRHLHASAVLPDASRRTGGGGPHRRGLAARRPVQDHPAAVTPRAVDARRADVPLLVERLPVAAHRDPDAERIRRSSSASPTSKARTSRSGRSSWPGTS